MVDLLWCDSRGWELARVEHVVWTARHRNGVHLPSYVLLTVDAKELLPLGLPECLQNIKLPFTSPCTRQLAVEMLKEKLAIGSTVGSCSRQSWNWLLTSARQSAVNRQLWVLTLTLFSAVKSAPCL